MPVGIDCVTWRLLFSDQVQTAQTKECWKRDSVELKKTNGEVDAVLNQSEPIGSEKWRKKTS